jgi:hypothetical protein
LLKGVLLDPLIAEELRKRHLAHQLGECGRKDHGFGALLLGRERDQGIAEALGDDFDLPGNVVILHRSLSSGNATQIATKLVGIVGDRVTLAEREKGFRQDSQEECDKQAT